MGFLIPEFIQNMYYDFYEAVLKKPLIIFLRFFWFYWEPTMNSWRETIDSIFDTTFYYEMTELNMPWLVNSAYYRVIYIFLYIVFHTPLALMWAFTVFSIMSTRIVYRRFKKFYFNNRLIKFYRVKTTNEHFHELGKTHLNWLKIQKQKRKKKKVNKKYKEIYALKDKQTNIFKFSKKIEYKF